MWTIACMGHPTKRAHVCCPCSGPISRSLRGTTFCGALAESVIVPMSTLCWVDGESRAISHAQQRELPNIPGLWPKQWPGRLPVTSLRPPNPTMTGQATGWALVWILPKISSDVQQDFPLKFSIVSWWQFCQISSLVLGLIFLYLLLNSKVETIEKLYEHSRRILCDYRSSGPKMQKSDFGVRCRKWELAQLQVTYGSIPIKK